MAAWSYLIITADGSRRSGVMEAPDRRSAAGRLRDGQAVVLSLDEQSGRARAARRRISLGLGLPAAQAASMFHQLAMMLRSGLPVVQALTVLSEHSPHPRVRSSAGRMAARILAGSAFSAALAAEEGLYPELAVRLAATGEASGELDVILERIATEIERRAELRTHVLTSLLYPGIIVLLAGAVVSFLVTRIIPTFARILASRSIEMPASTQAMMAATDWLNGHWPHLACTAAAIPLTVYLLARVPRARLWMDGLLMRLPVVGGILTMAATAQLGRTLSTLLASGVPVLEALRLLRSSFSNRVMVERIANAERGLLEGQPLSHLLRGRPIPAMVPELVAVGELAGDVDRVLAEIGDHHEAQLRQRIKVLSLLVEPALIIVIGAIVGFVYLSFFQVLFQMYKH
ncbi:MAG: type II secretion system F family protein [Planctomycetes bacterium]|nr:type II secretion system F family protein [Planctomycetota bacterium]